MVNEFTSDFKREFESTVNKMMASSGVPGMSVSVIKNDNIIYSRGFGSKNLQENTPATSDTLFGIGSCTKSFTALAVMKLFEKGLLDLSDPISKYLPIEIGKEDKPISIHHLLTMSSGIPNLGMAEILLFRETGVKEKFIPMSSMDDLFQYINEANDEVVDEAGERFFYLNSGYTLLGEIVARVSGKSFAEYVEQEILKPLDMKRSTFTEEKFTEDEERMTPYRMEFTRDERKALPAKNPFHYFIQAPGGLLSSTNELTNYLRMHMNNGIFADQKIVDKSSLEKMQSIHCESQQYQDTLREHGKRGYGYGWMVIEDFFGERKIAHGGSTFVSSAQLAFIPALKIGIAAAANTGHLPVLPLDAVLLYLMGRNPKKDLPELEIEKKLQMLTGKYETYRGVNQVEIKKRGSLLYVETKLPGMGDSYPLLPVDDRMENFQFYAYTGVGTKLMVEFVVESPQKIDLYLERNRFHKTF